MGELRYPATLLCDFYKVSHKDQYPEGTQTIYSTWTPRSNRYMPTVNKVVSFGVQSFIKEYLINYFNEMFFKKPLFEVVDEYKRVLKFTLNVEDPDTSHIESLWKLGYLPIKVKAIPEGMAVPIKTPMVTIENTVDEFFWLTNYLETLFSSEVWQPMTAASIATKYYEIGAKYADETVGDRLHLPFQFHDFSFRGMEGLTGAAASGAAHLLPFTGTDTIPSILYHEKYYGANIETELVGASIPATEHSVMCAYGQDELASFKRLITEVYPNGLVSIVADTWDFWGIIKNVLPKLKIDIINRFGKVVIRPDSGDPVEILCGKFIPEFESIEEAQSNLEDDMFEEARNDCEGSHNIGEDKYVRLCKVEDSYYKVTTEFEYNRHDKTYYYVDGSRTTSEEFTPELSDLGLIESLWNIFGGFTNNKGYKVLNESIGAIYGDSITLERAEEIFRRLKEKGFASSNVVLGVGSYTYQYNTRDTFGFAMKATYARINGEEKFLFKDPKTDDGTKKSLKGMVAVLQEGDGVRTRDELEHIDRYILEVEGRDLLETVFIDGALVKETTLSEIRERLLSNL